MPIKKTVALVGARGYTGRELVRLIANHPSLALAVVGSRSDAGKEAREELPDAPPGMKFTMVGPENIGGIDTDVIVLALPNGLAAPYAANARPDQVVVDLSADFRFDESWVYGFPERYRRALGTAKRISNPGCYATCMQLALLPLAEFLRGPPSCFGVSGYSGAGTTKSPHGYNDPERLRDNLMPYALTGHIHQREVSRQLGAHVHFMPHVAPFFQGISITADIRLTRAISSQHALELYSEYYKSEPLVRVGSAVPYVRDNSQKHFMCVGGFAEGSAINKDDHRLVVVSTIDNLLKGAATQALQNMNIALGLPEFDGIPLD